MTWDRIEQQWIRIKGPIQEQWTRLSDRDMEQIHGKRERLLGRIQELYGVRRADAERQVDRFLHGY
jgi:uncharacterized protein YjbJ (UPF0337 family)